MDHTYSEFNGERLAIAAGKRNDADQVRKVMDVALPRPDRPLVDWQAVVIGGGIINGISQQGVWPNVRLKEILRGNQDLTDRWRQALAQASAMADNEKVPTGTRYDALRMIPLDTWERCGPRLARYLAKGTHDELQMGAISGMSDIDSPQIAPLLLSGLDHFSTGNRRIALDALLRTDARTEALLDAIEKERVRPSVLGDAQVKALRESKSQSVRERAGKLFSQ